MGWRRSGDKKFCSQVFDGELNLMAETARPVTWGHSG